MARVKNKLSKCCKAALWYVNKGWYVFPCDVTKKPMITGGFHSATTDHEQVKQWWVRWPNAAIGVDTGRSGLVVIDLDQHGDKNGFISWRKLGFTLDGAMISRTPNGGRHLIYKDTTGGEVKNSASKLGPGIDVRSNGGYILVPPSEIHSGFYQALSDWKLDPAPLPDELRDAILAEKKPENRRYRRKSLRTFNRNNAESRLLRWAVNNAEMGRRNENGFWLATKLRDYGLNFRQAKRVMFEYADRVPQYKDDYYTKGEALLSLKSAYNGR
jgi:hypothetical protein